MNLRPHQSPQPGRRSTDQVNTATSNQPRLRPVRSSSLLRFTSSSPSRQRCGAGVKTTVTLCAALSTISLAACGDSDAAYEKAKDFNESKAESGTSTTQAGRSASNDSLSSRHDQCDFYTLPPDADDVVEDVQAGGPFDFAKDGSHFGNYQHRLPQERSDYYREYTVETEGQKSRGEKRIVTGGRNPRKPEVWYYTDDHYNTFCRIVSVPTKTAEPTHSKSR